jgi:hypothetical protein
MLVRPSLPKDTIHRVPPHARPSCLLPLCKTSLTSRTPRSTHKQCEIKPKAQKLYPDVDGAKAAISLLDSSARAICVTN